MPRAGGVYTLPSGNPVVTLTVISSAWANSTLSDIATALTGSVPTDGSAPLTGPLRLVDGAVGTPGLAWASETTSGWYRIGLNQFGFSVGANAALTVNANRGWTIPAPSSGTALTVNGLSSGTAVAAFAGNSTGIPIQLMDIAAAPTSLAVAIIGVGTAAFPGGSGAAGDLVLIPRSSASNSILLATGNGTPSVRLQVNSAGNVTINAPSSGTAFTVNGTGGVTSSFVNGSTVLLFQGTGAGATSFGTNSAHDFTIISGGVNRTTWSTAGNVTMAAPTSGSGLSVTGASASFTAQFFANATSGSSFGVNIQGGTTTADQALSVLNQSGSTAFLRVFGDGSVQVGSPTGGNQGLGTINATGLYVQGVQANVLSAHLSSTVGISSTTPANDPTLTLPLASGKTYLVRCYMSITAINAGGIQAYLVYGGTSSSTSLAGKGVINGVNFVGQATSFGSFNYGGAAVAANDFVVYEGVITTTSASNVIVQYRLNSASGTTTLAIGSYITAAQIN